MGVYAFGANWAMTPYFSEGMEILPEIKGVTASLLTSARLLITASVIGVVSSFYDKTIIPMAVAIALIVPITLLTIYFYESRKAAAN